MAWCSVSKKHRDNFTFTFYLYFLNFVQTNTNMAAAGTAEVGSIIASCNIGT